MHAFRFCHYLLSLSPRVRSHHQSVLTARKPASAIKHSQPFLFACVVLYTATGWSSPFYFKMWNCISIVMFLMFIYSTATITVTCNIFKCGNFYTHRRWMVILATTTITTTTMMTGNVAMGADPITATNRVVWRSWRMECCPSLILAKHAIFHNATENRTKFEMLLTGIQHINKTEQIIKLLDVAMLFSISTPQLTPLFVSLKLSFWC